MDLLHIVILALLVEAIWETLKMAWQDGKFSWDRFGALAVAIFICVLCKADLFTPIGVDMGSPIIAYVLTGVLASRGSNFLHDLIEKVNGKTTYEIVYDDSEDIEE